MLYDCYLLITGRYYWICQLFKKCTIINFPKNSVLETFIIQKRPDNSRSWNCTAVCSLNFMEKILTQVMYISWSPLVADLTVDRTPNFFQVLFFHLDTAFSFLIISTSKFVFRKSTFSHVCKTEHITNKFQRIPNLRKNMQVLPILHTCVQQSFGILRQGLSLTRSNLYVCSCANVYDIITKIIVAFRSRPGNVVFHIAYKVGDNQSKTNNIIK